MTNIKWVFRSINKTLLISFFAVFSVYLLSETGLLILPLLYGQILNTVESTRTFPLHLFMMLLGFTVLLLTLRSYTGFINSRQQAKIHEDLCLVAIKKIFNLPPSNVAEKGSKYYTDTVLERTREVSTLFDIKAMTGIINLIKLFVITVIIFFIDKIVGVVSVVLILVSIYIYKYGNEYFMKHNKELKKKKMEYLSNVEDTINNKEEIHVLNAFSCELKRNSIFTEELKKMASKIFVRDFIHFFIELDFVRIFYELFVFAWGLYQAYIGSYQIGTGIVLIGYSTMITGPIVYLNSILLNIKNSLNAVDILKELEVKEEGVIVPEGEIEEIIFDKVNYTVNGRDIFKDFSFSIKKGEKIAILGPSGKGKSTLVSLILKDVKPTSGKILINGKDINFISKDWLYQQIAVLSQNSTLFPATIEENIKLGEDFYRREELEGILRKVKLPFDLDYTIEENASNVSQGEKERVLLARLIAHNKNFVILDEPLEGVDIETKKEIISFLKEYLKDRTVLVITHRDEIAQSLCEREMMV